jgi:DNA-3-methyladenine glycosylase
MRPVSNTFFDQPAQSLAIALLGCVLRRRVTTASGNIWLAARIIETEAYELTDRGSHASLGETPSRRALFMPAGTIYMYYARGGDSLNFSAHGAGNAVLIKSGIPHIDPHSPAENIAVMQRLNPSTRGPRPLTRLCNGQTLICKALNLKVPDWNQQRLRPHELRLEQASEPPEAFVRCPRLGIPMGRDQDLHYRYVDLSHAKHCTKNPLTRRGAREGVDYSLHALPAK